MRKIYQVGYLIVFVPVFIGAWIYCANEYGFLLGFGLGWLPASLSAAIAAFMWPLIAVVIVGLVGINHYKTYYGEPSYNPVAPVMAPASEPQKPPKVATPVANPQVPSEAEPIQRLIQRFWEAHRTGDKTAVQTLGGAILERTEEATARAATAGDSETVAELHGFRWRIEEAMREAPR